MKNLMLTIKNTFHLFDNGMNGVNNFLHLSKGEQDKTLEFYNDEGIKKVFDVHHYSQGQTILFKR